MGKSKGLMNRKGREDENNVVLLIVRVMPAKHYADCCMVLHRNTVVGYHSNWNRYRG